MTQHEKITTEEELPRKAVGNLIADKCADLALAASSYTYGVGAIVHQGNHVITTAKNKVYQYGQLHNSSAHAEIQAIRRHEELIKAGEAPPFNKAKLTTSLCPCMMCTGALLRMAQTGNSYDAVNFIAIDRHLSPARDIHMLPPALRYHARSLFKMLPTYDQNGLSNDPEAISPKTLEIAEAAYITARTRLKQERAERRSRMSDDKSCDSETPHEHDSTRLHLDDNHVCEPIVETLVQLASAAKEGGNEMDAAILFDASGRELFRAGSATGSFILQTPIMGVIEQYEKWHLALENQGKKAPAFSSLRLVCLREPQLMEIGRIDSAALGTELKEKMLSYLIPDRELGVQTTGFLRTIQGTHPDVAATVERVPQKRMRELAEKLFAHHQNRGIGE